MTPSPEGWSDTILGPSSWQMTLGERAVLVGLLSQLRPRLALEIGTAQGGSLRELARHSDEVHSFDLVPPSLSLHDLRNVTLHTGDSHALLPELLASLAGEGRNVDFVLVDGDHSSEGARADLEHLFESAAVTQTVILVHDTLNEQVRRGVEPAIASARDKIVHADLDLVVGHLSQSGPFALQLWGGLGLVMDGGAAGAAEEDQEFYDPFELLLPVRDALAERRRVGDSFDATAVQALLVAGGADVDRLREELMRTRQGLREMQRSPSWRLTAPLRTAKRAVRSKATRR